VLQWYDYDLPAAERAYRRALELNPRSVEVHTWYSILLDAQGRINEAMEWARRAHELDPLSARTVQSIASLLLRLGRAEEALEAARRIVPLDPTSERGHPLIARAYIALDRPAEAVAHLEHTLETIRPGHNLRAHLAHALAAAGRHDDARAVAAALERDAWASTCHPAPWPSRSHGPATRTPPSTGSSAAIATATRA
jgi:tetratricopeptide (TPR) repeat protein